MSQQIPLPPKRVVSRNIAVVLGVICIILIAGLGGALAYYTLQIENRDTKYNEYASTHSHTDSDYNSLSAQNSILVNQNTILANQVNNLTSILNFGNSTIWVNDQIVTQGISSYSTWVFSANYSGYVSVLVQGSTVSGTWVELSYYAYGVSFAQTQVVSVGNTASFPILPCKAILVGVGNGLVVGSGATETVTITYTY